ncbi:MAG: hypothetical protein CMF23_15975 [Ignavibacteriae bacterium]|jgi:hypothetical protein|nr:hypothetical protein [Ignavibacteriota bacterium]MBZ0180709.1 hypothetical protein [Melioribacteraceae bacterium]
MNSKLKQLLEKIDYKNLFEASERRVEKILAEYRSEKNTIENFDEFKECLIEFISKIYGAIINSPDAFEEAAASIMYERTIYFLKDQYPQNTEMTLYEIMHSGAEGGVYQVLKILAKSMTDQIYKDGVEHFVSVYINGLDFSERETAAKEYLEEFGDILPLNYKNDPFSVVISFERVLIEHPFMIKRLQELS